MRRGVLGVGFMIIASIFFLALVIIVFAYLYQETTAVYNPGIKEIISNEKLGNDGEIALINFLRTNKDGMNLVEYVYINRNDNDKIEDAFNAFGNLFCILELEHKGNLKEITSNVAAIKPNLEHCEWELIIDFSDADVKLGDRKYKEDAYINHFEFIVDVPEPSFKSANIKLDVFHGLRIRGSFFDRGLIKIK